MTKFLNGLTVLFFAFLVIVAFFFFLQAFQLGDRRIHQGEEAYRKGESAATLSERKEAFNAALDLFLQLNNDYHPRFGSGKLDFAIANTFFQLEEYPLSILYYKRAENLLPRSDLVKRNLSKAQNKMGLKAPENHRFFDTLLLKSYVSLPERLQFFSFFDLCLLFLLSAWIWTRKTWLLNMSLVFLFPFVLLLMNLGLTYYFSPVEAVLIHATELRRDAGIEFAKVGDLPIPGGTTVDIVSVSPNGKWLKIAAPNGEFGYVSSETAKLVDLY